MNKLIDQPAQQNTAKDLLSASPLDIDSFPNKPSPGHTNIPTTIPNVKHLLNSYGIVARYNVISKKLMTRVPGLSGMTDNADNSAMSHILSLAALNRMATGLVTDFVAAIADENPINPVADWIDSKVWDGKCRLRAFYETLVTPDEFPSVLKETLLLRWLISAVAAALTPSGFKSRGVLTLQGPQSIGKTTWISNLVPDDVLKAQALKLDHHLDASNKDSLLAAISHWIVEIGELDSSFKKDISRLKGFLTNDRDKIRKPYAKTFSECARKTVFCATVNDSNFLVDTTGNTRWWTIPVIKINYDHDIDMQQLFAQIAGEFKAGTPWWLTPEEERELESHNRKHQSVSVIKERILAAIDTKVYPNQKLPPAMTPTELLIKIGISHPTNTQCKEAGSVLREQFGESKRINGFNKWRIPLRTEGAASYDDDDDDRF